MSWVNASGGAVPADAWVAWAGDGGGRGQEQVNCRHHHHYHHHHCYCHHCHGHHCHHLGLVMEGGMDKSRCIVSFVIFVSIVIFVTLIGITGIVVNVVTCRGRLEMCMLVELATKEASTLEHCCLTGPTLFGI